MPSGKRLALAVLLTATPAFAHPGDHSQMTLLMLIQHYAEPDHLAFLAFAVLVGWLAFRAGRRVEARRRIDKDRQP